MNLALIPVYNEESTIEQTLEMTAAWAERIIVVDDGSTDRSLEAIRRWSAAKPGRVELIQLERNQGMSAAIKAGLAAVAAGLHSGKFSPEDPLLLIDADGQYAGADLGALEARLRSGPFDLVIVRRDFSCYPMYKRLGNGLLSAWASALAGFRFEDVEAGLRALRAGAVPPILKEFRGRRYSCAQEIAVIAALAGLKVDNSWLHPVSYYRSRTQLKDVLINSWMALAAAWRMRG